MKSELTTSKVAFLVAKVEVEATLTQMKSVTVDTTLHTRAKLMDEFKAS